MKSRILLALAIVLAGQQLLATPEEDAAKRLAEYYYKGSEMERRINYVIGNMPVQLQLSLTYAGQVANIYGGGLLVYRKEF